VTVFPSAPLPVLYLEMMFAIDYSSARLLSFAVHQMFRLRCKAAACCSVSNLRLETAVMSRGGLLGTMFAPQPSLAPQAGRFFGEKCVWSLCFEIYPALLSSEEACRRTGVWMGLGCRFAAVRFAPSRYHVRF
jgi:hypothetical protein